MISYIILKLTAFINKAKHRGFRWVVAVLTYYLRRNTYFLRLGLTMNLGTEDQTTDFFGESSSIDQEALLLYFLNRMSPAFHFGPADIGSIVASVPDTVKRRTIKSAEDVCHRTFNFRDIGEYTFDNKINWNYAFKGNIGWNWDLNRHPYFLDLAKAFYYTGDKQYIEELIDLWRDWIQHNPAGRATTWAYPFEVAARLNNWMWAFFFVAYSGFASADRIRYFLRSMHDHALYLYSNLELHWPNNHLFLETKALLEFSILFPEMDQKKRFFRRSVKIFRQAIAQQVLPDGCHSELCSMYHRIVTGELLELFDLAEKNRIQLYHGLEQIIIDMETFSSALLREDGSMPLLGDSTAEDNYIRFETGQHPKADGIFWLQAGNPMKRLKSNVQKNDRYFMLFPHGGYAFIIDKRVGKAMHMVFDCGQFSKNPASDHSHCDALSFDLYSGGRPLIIDPGCFYSVQDRMRWHQYFRSTIAHNTLMIDGREQSQLWRDSDVKKTADVKLLDFSCSEDMLTIRASCAPYWASNEGICHIRRIDYDLAGKISIVDRVNGSSRHSMRWFFHFAPGIEVIKGGDGVIWGYDEKTSPLFRIDCNSKEELTLTVDKGNMSSLLGWSPLNGVQVLPAYWFSCWIDTKLPFDCAFNITTLS